jgi:hypothetical protein
METMFITKMSVGNMNTTAERKLVEQCLTRSEILSRAATLQATEAPQPATHPRDTAGEQTIYGHVDRVGNPTDFAGDAKLKAAVATLSVNGRFFEKTPPA